MSESLGAPPLLPMDELWQTTLQWRPTPDQQALFQQLYTMLLAGNQTLNLTRITGPEEFWEKHLWDSLRGLREFLPTSNPLTLIDIGTGGGFPGIPAAIALPHSHVTLLDATHKKVAFLQDLVQTLNLPNGIPWCDRAESLGRQPKHREQYDLALLRAVAPAQVCAEYGLPLVRVGGQAILYRGQWTPEEQTDLERAVTQLGGQVVRVDAFTTPLSLSQRHCIYVQKVTPTPRGFPRAVGIPRQRPL